MTKKEAIKIFEEKKVRTVWDDETEEWFFSIVDVVSILTESVDGRKYWNKLKQRLKAEGSELVTNCHQLKLPSTDGKYYKTDVATTEQLFRLIQSIPSPKAEPFKLWMAQVAKERLDEMQDPELTIDRAMREYKALGYSDNWINQRLKSIEIRKDLTDEWKRHSLLFFLVLFPEWATPIRHVGEVQIHSDFVFRPMLPFPYHVDAETVPRSKPRFHGSGKILLPTVLHRSMHAHHRNSEVHGR